jgi:TolA-binding protein
MRKTDAHTSWCSRDKRREANVSARNFARSLLLLATALPLAGCASQADLEQVQRNELQLRSMIAEDRQQIQQLQDRISQMENLVREMGPSSAPSVGRGRITNQRLSNIEQRLSRLEATANLAPSAGGVPSGAGTTNPGTFAPLTIPAAAAPETPHPPERGATVKAPDLNTVLDQELNRAKNASGADARIYAAGLEAMRQGRYTPAISQFGSLKKRFPKSALNEPAQYFSALALYHQGKFDESILQFNDLAMRYPTGRFAVPALLYEARAFLKINDKIDARLTLQKLIADHGDSPQVSAARELMKSLESD